MQIKCEKNSVLVNPTEKLQVTKACLEAEQQVKIKLKPPFITVSLRKGVDFYYNRITCFGATMVLGTSPHEGIISKTHVMSR